MVDVLVVLYDAGPTPTEWSVVGVFSGEVGVIGGSLLYAITGEYELEPDTDIDDEEVVVPLQPFIMTPFINGSVVNEDDDNEEDEDEDPTAANVDSAVAIAAGVDFIKLFIICGWLIVWL